MRVTSITQLGAELRLPPPTVTALRSLSLADVAALRQLIETARTERRSAMEKALGEVAGPLPLARAYRRITRGRES